MPAKKASTVAKYPKLFPNSGCRAKRALGNISTNETYIIAPAEKPRESVKNVVFDLRVLSPNKLPIPVDNPANMVRPNANKLCWDALTIIDDSVYLIYILKLSRVLIETQQVEYLTIFK